ncbi:MAG: DNA repair exonuclease [Firmicutes bacterium]|jgi:DNA repair exonuclease SbcCD nuclease subunit|nr:DNA repair exonuclease [Bacillota bacterium]
MLRILHLADLHLGWAPSYLGGEKKKVRLRERNQLLAKAVDFALSPGNDIHAVFIVGDLFEDYRPDESLVRQVLDNLGRLTTAGLRVITVPGNHDEITYRDSVYRQHGANWPGELVVNPMPELSVSVEVNGTGLHVYALAFTGGLTIVSSIEKFPRKDLPGLHIGAFHGSLDWEGVADRSLPLKSGLLKEAGYDYIALGHIHRYTEKTVGKGMAVYPGAAEFKSFNDPGTGGLVVAEYSGGRIKIEKAELDIRRHQIRNLELSGLEGADDLLETCKSFADPEAMVQLTFKGTPPFHFGEEQLLDALEPYFFYIEIKNETEYFSDTFLESLAQEPTVRGNFVRRLRKKQATAENEQERKLLGQAMRKGLAALQGVDQV